MNDDLIIKQLAEYNEHTTKKYFYDYCRKAYEIFNQKYQLKNKIGLDFYSLAHEYYIYLMVHNFKPLLDRPENVRLSTWMTNGFRFIVLDALKAYNKEFSQISDTTSDEILEYVRSSDHDENLMEQLSEAVSSHYSKDRIMQEIGHMVLYAGFSQKEIAAQLGITPAAVNQRYKKMMDEVITPYVIENYSDGIYNGAAFDMEVQQTCMSAIADYSFGFMEHRFLHNIFRKIHNNKDMDNNRITPNFIKSLNHNEIFVFGSNLMGLHGGGAARMAHTHFGAVMGNGDGLQGQSYAIPTMQGDVDTIEPYVDKFIEFAKQHPEMKFLVTQIGCGIAGFEPRDIAPLFKAATDVENIYLPESFWNILR